MSESIDLRPGDRILVSRTDRLGDLVLALPLVETLKLRYPECPVDVLASLYASPILENNQSIDKIIRVQNDQLKSSKLYRKDFLHRLKMNNYRVVVALYPERQVCRVFHRASIPDRIGTVGRFHSVFFNHHLMHTRKSNKKHECEYNLDFLKFFRSGESVALPRVYPSEKDIRNARRILGETGVGDYFVVLHPCSGGSADRWPLERFEQLANVLNQHKLNVVISGSAEERLLIDDGMTNLSNDITVIAGETDLRTLTAIMSLAQVVVANSTGPLHLAAAVATSVVGLYPGQQSMSPVRWGPLGDGHTVIRPSGSESEKLSVNPPSMETIEVEGVLDSILKRCQNPLKGTRS